MTSLLVMHIIYWVSANLPNFSHLLSYIAYFASNLRPKSFNFGHPKIVGDETTLPCDDARIF